MFHNQTLCDVKFKFKNSEEIGAHVAILTAGSPVFAAMLQPDFIESKSRIVNIADIEMDVFKEMLTYLYTGKAPNLLEIHFIRLVYEVADKYGVKSLKDDCENLLVSQLSNNNAIELLVWAQFHSLPKLFEKAVQFIAKNSEELCSQPAGLDFMKDHPKLCLEINQRMAKLIAEGYDNDFFSDEE
jgi:speckle-type POZ protein